MVVSDAARHQRRRIFVCLIIALKSSAKRTLEVGIGRGAKGAAAALVVV